MAIKDDGTNSDLIAIPAGHLFGLNVARVAFKRSAYLRNFVYTFAELLSPDLTRSTVESAMSGHANDF
jgi:LysR family cys regulon transcriptional activator